MSSEETTMAAGNLDGRAAPRPAAALARRQWTLTQEAFDCLLAQLDPDPESAGKRYVEVRRNLVRLFEWRGCPFPEDHADETLNRVARKALEGEDIRDPVSYLQGTARRIVLEVHKQRAKEQVALAGLATVAVAEPSESQGLERRVGCLQHCLGGLPAGNRELILQYYQGDKRAKIENRKQLTDRLRIPINTLRMRALRLREKLQSCVEECLAV